MTMDQQRPHRDRADSPPFDRLVTKQIEVTRTFRIVDNWPTPEIGINLVQDKHGHPLVTLGDQVIGRLDDVTSMLARHAANLGIARWKDDFSVIVPRFAIGAGGDGPAMEPNTAVVKVPGWPGVIGEGGAA